MPMSVARRKAKGREACAAARDEILKTLPLHPDDIQITSSGATGEDLLLSPKARQMMPFVFEVKNQESLNIWESYAQAETHWSKKVSKEEFYPALIYKRNRSDLMITMSMEDFMHFAFLRKRKVEDEQSRDIHSP
jgi:hypothetical protein